MSASQRNLKEIAEYTLSKRVGRKSQRGYKGKMNTIKVWFLEDECRHQYLDANNEMKVPPQFPVNVLSDLFSWLSTNPDLPRGKRSKKALRAITASADDADQLYFEPNRDEVDGRNDCESDSDEDKVESFPEQVDNSVTIAAHKALSRVEEALLDGPAANYVTIAVSTMQGYKSAIKFWYWQKAKILMHPHIDAFLDNFIHGYKKIIAEKKARGIMNMSKGRKPYTFFGYRFLSRVLMVLKPRGKKYPFKESVFGWAFEVLAWNLISRSCNVEALMFPLFGWREDCMVIKVPKHKGDQTGDSISKDKHTYANPLMPEVCPILATAIAVFCIDRKRGDYRLFTESTSDQFCHLLTVLFDDAELIPPDVNLGAARQELGSHSNRKGAASYLQNLSPSLSAVNINLRAGWSVGNVQDRYIFAGAAGDQLVGRGAAGLPINSRKFSVLPPHFSQAGLEKGRRIGWGNLIPDYDEFPPSFQQVVIFFLASIIYHHDFLRDNIDSQHPLFSKRLFTRSIVLDEVRYANGYEALHDTVLTGYDRCPDCGMTATGIPTHILLANQIEELRTEIQSQKQQIQHLQEKQQESLQRYQDDLLKEIRGLPDALRENLLENFNIEGASPLNMRDIRRIIEDNNAVMLQEISEKIESLSALVKSGSSNVAGAAVQTQECQLSSPSAAPEFISFQWGGKYRMVPADFVFPDVSVKTMWDLWFFGNSGKQIRPYKKLSEFLDDLRTKLDKVNYSRAKKVMGMLESVVKEQGLLPDSVSCISGLSLAAADNVFERALQEVLCELYPQGRCKRGHEVMYATLANRKYNKKLKVGNDRLIEDVQPKNTLGSLAIAPVRDTPMDAAATNSSAAGQNNFWSEDFEKMFGVGS